MAGIYIHVPFCKQKCIYCNFYSIPSLEMKDGYLQALSKEIHQQKDYLLQEKISTVYFGGGTPSLLNLQELDIIFNELNSIFPVEPDAEITIEANPEHLNKGYLLGLKQLGWINRLSIGIQSFFDEDLKLLNRKHTGEESSKCILSAQEMGFNNLSVDLIYGIPTLSNSKWIANLQQAFKLGIQHLSCYALTVEPNTMLDKMIQKGIAPFVSEEQCVEQFEILLEQINKHGFIQYEISNFCKSGYESKHNSNYWNDTKYLGLGASAHSYNGISRQWNFSNVSQYISAIENQKLSFEIEYVSDTDRYNEYIMTALRTNNGISKHKIQNSFQEYYSFFLDSILQFTQNNLIIEIDDSFILSNKGKLFADKIAAGLFF